jgi:hypothetical protein
MIALQLPDKLLSLRSIKHLFRLYQSQPSGNNQQQRLKSRQLAQFYGSSGFPVILGET